MYPARRWQPFSRVGTAWCCCVPLRTPTVPLGTGVGVKLASHAPHIGALWWATFQGEESLRGDPFFFGQTTKKPRQGAEAFRPPRWKRGRKVSFVSLPQNPHPAQRRKSCTKPGRTTRTRGPLVPPAPDNDHEMVPRLHADRPTCCPFRFCRKASAMLDMILLAQAVLGDLKSALEEEVME